MIEGLQHVYEKVCIDLLSQMEPDGHWVGELSSSALSTATSVSALSVVLDVCEQDETVGGDYDSDALRAKVDGGVAWLLDHQNPDGGWGDTDRSHSNIATTMLVRAALHLAGRAESCAGELEKADSYVKNQDGLTGLRRRYGTDKTFVIPILTNCAIAGLVPWEEVDPLPFELACFPQSWYRFVGMPVVSYAIPALVAIGQARYFHRKPLNPIMRLVRATLISPSLRVLRRMQPDSGGYLEAAPLTGFVLMSLASTSRAGHPVAKECVRFLVDSYREDGSWPIDTNLATWNTTLAINALHDFGKKSQDPAAGNVDRKIFAAGTLDWLVRDCHHKRRHPFTGAQPGGWGWTDLSGAVPDADDTSGALLALARWRERSDCTKSQQQMIHSCGTQGVRWLLDLQNRDGGWPTFCRGWGRLPFDRSGADLSAHAMRALRAWREGSARTIKSRIDRAISGGFEYLASRQHRDGSWSPLWFGNQDHPEEDNPVYATSRVLLAYGELDRIFDPASRRGLDWLVKSQNGDGSWGGNGEQGTVEETALALEGLLCGEKDDPDLQHSLRRGLGWIASTVGRDGHRKGAPIGFYFAKLWYYERLYPLVFLVSTIGKALEKLPNSPSGSQEAPV